MYEESKVKPGRHQHRRLNELDSVAQDYFIAAGSLPVKGEKCGIKTGVLHRTAELPLLLELCKKAQDLVREDAE